LKELNSIIHHEVLAAIHSKIAEARREGIPAVVIDAPLLIEAGLEEVCDKVIVVTAGREVQKKRIHADDRFSYSEVRARTSFQLSPEDKKKKADYVIDNSSSLENTRRQVNEIWEGIK
jgi:dephospho-CoA kinase